MMKVITRKLKDKRTSKVKPSTLHTIRAKVIISNKLA